MSGRPYNNNKRPFSVGTKPSFDKKPFGKAHFNKSSYNGKPGGKTQSTNSNTQDKQRKRPITSVAPIDEDEDASMPSDVGDEAADATYEQGAGEGYDANGEPAAKRPRMTKSERAALHAAQPHRTALLPTAPLLNGKLLPMWERARRADLSKAERTDAINKLWGDVKGHVGEISRGHKGTRILQTIVKYGGKDERLGVAMELQPRWREMMESKYSKYLMGKLLRYCPSIRPLLISAIQPHLIGMLQHADAVKPLSDFYDLWATGKERRALVRGFYPREVKVFDGKDGDKGLEEVLDGLGADGKGRERILDGIEKVILQVFNATQKTALAQGVFHHLVWEYLVCIYRFLTREEADRKLQELLTASLESLPDIMHTTKGSAVVRELIVRTTAKDRKQILQQLKKHLEAMCKDADAQTVLFTAFDCVDDTKLMGKTFVTDIVSLVPSLIYDANGRRAILYLLTPTSTRHFMPSTLKSLAECADAARKAETSKKDPTVRRKELLGYASEGLLSAIRGSAEEYVRDAAAGLVVQEIMLYAVGDKSAAVTALMQPLQIPYPDTPPADDALDPATSHLLDLPHSSRTYRNLLAGGHFDSKAKQVDVVNSALSTQVGEALWRAIIEPGHDNVVRIATGNGAFVLVELLAALKGQPDVLEEIKKVLGGKKVRDQIIKAVRRGGSLLEERLGEL